MTRWMLLGMWAAIATSGAAGLWGISGIPKIDPEIETLCNDLRRRMGGPAGEPPPADASLARVLGGWTFHARALQPPAFAATLVPLERVRVEERPPVEVDVQRLQARPAATASLDGVTLTWTLAEGEVAFAPHERPRLVAPTGLRVERREGNGPWKETARLDAKAGSWKDVEAAFRTSYAYRVLLDAPENAREAAQGTSEAPVRTGSERRARLVGGDAKVAIVRVEAYNRKSGTWARKDVTVRPGEEIWPGGWRLTGLRFKGFYLVAEAVDEDGRAVELTTGD